MAEFDFPDNRERGSGGRFLLGALLGVALGALGGLAALRRGRETAAVDLLAVQERPDGDTVVMAEERVTVLTPSPLATAQTRATGLVDSIRGRWQAAMSAGKAAAQEREAELNAQLAADRARKPGPEIEGYTS